MEAIARATEWPRGLYVHVPYCASKCPYCDFNSYALRAQGHLRSVVDAILREASHWADVGRAARGGFHTVFIGGGTPSILPPRQMDRLLRGLRERLPLSEVGEWTVEANPGTLTPEKAEVLVRCGVNRVSLGVQSMVDAELVALGRIHDSRAVVRSVRVLAEAGVSRLSVDLMFGVPGQTPGTLSESLERAVHELGAGHVSAYCLTLEDGTPFFARWREGSLSLPGEDVQEGMYRTVVEQLEGWGVARYEISNFARPGQQCAHNLNYWRQGSYLGLGPGAHSHWEGFRFSTVTDPARYAAAAARGVGATVDSVERPAARQRMDERVMLELRLAEGLDGQRFCEDFGLAPEEAFGRGVWEHLEEGGFIVRRGMRLALTGRGFLVADAVIRAITASATRVVPSRA